MSLQFSCCHGKTWTFPYALKMAEGGIAERERNIFVGGRVRVLINAMRFMEEERRGRVGRTPPNLEAPQETNLEGRQEVGQA